MDLKALGGIFLEGILSFLSPCVLPLIPLYMSYLAGNDKTVDEEGNVRYKTGKVFITTLFFVLGICLTFVLLTLSVNAFKSFFDRYSNVISIIGGTLLIVFSFHQMGLIHIDVLDKELRMKYDLHPEKMNFFKAFLMGLVFSLGWSPCIGPLLANAIFMAASSADGYIYILAYGLGLIIPFLLVGLFTSSALNLINKRRSLFKWILKISGIVMLCFGVYMIANGSKAQTQVQTADNVADSSTPTREEIEQTIMDYEFSDVEGNKLHLSDLKGKYVFLNFTTTWCTYCQAEIPEYKEFAENEEVICLYVMSELQERSADDLKTFVKENDISIPVINDAEGFLFYHCQISAFPTTYVIAPDGHFLSYYVGAIDLDGMNSLLEYSKQLYEE